MSRGTTTPVLRIFDEATAVEFYRDSLGFNVDWERSPGRFRRWPAVTTAAPRSRGTCCLRPDSRRLHLEHTENVAV